MMCGFVGVAGATVPPDKLSAALATIAHRGPDGHQVLLRGGHSIAACRLAITPPLDAPPLASSPCSWLALNGELYDLARTDSETDTLAAFTRLTHESGEINVSLSHLRGLFAMAYSDEHGVTTLARDHFGIKPLYWANWNGGVAFASEMKALLALGVNEEPDRDVLASFSAIGFNVFRGRTPFRHISSIIPGSTLTVENDASWRMQYFQRQKIEASTLCSEEEIDFEVERRLIQSLRRTMLHDSHPKALFLSGGLDSTLLLHLAASFGKIEAFTLWDGVNVDDCAEAKIVAEGLGVAWHPLVVTPDMLDQAITHYSWHFERPIGGGGFDLLGGVAFHVLTAEIAKTHRVALCGEGADELFYGYHKFHVDPESLASEMTQRIASTRNEALREWAFQSGLEHPASARVSLARLARREGLSEYHLPSVDASGMAYGLEIRPPFLDVELVNFVESLPTESLVNYTKGLTKMPLRRIMSRLALKGHRSPVRRKRAMAFSITAPWHQLLRRMVLKDENALIPLMASLHTYLRRISPSEPPTIPFSEIVSNREVRAQCMSF